MSVDTKHPQYLKNSPRWSVIDDWLDEQDVIRSKGEKYLPKTSGMKKATNGNEQYTAYLSRARAPSVARSALSGIMGLVFKKDPVGGESTDPVTNTGLSVIQLARDATRAVVTHGRVALVVDAPSEGGDPYITIYSAHNVINWKTKPHNEYELELLVLEEQKESGDEFSHDTKTQYRVYRAEGDQATVQLYNDKQLPIDEPIVLPSGRISAVIIGSINTSPDCDPIPLHPVVNCAIAAYQVSADLKQDLFLSGQKQLYMAGCTEEQFQANLSAGYGSGSAWYLGEEGSAGFLESTGNSYAEMSQEREHELSQAETYAVSITRRGDGDESGKALQIRAAAQHSSIYTIADSVSIGINQALQMRAKWAGLPAPETFYLQTDFTDTFASEQMLRALNDAVNSLNAPRSSMFELLRQSGLTSEEDEELERQIREDSTALPLPSPTTYRRS